MAGEEGAMFWERSRQHERRVCIAGYNRVRLNVNQFKDEIWVQVQVKVVGKVQQTDLEACRALCLPKFQFLSKMEGAFCGESTDLGICLTPRLRHWPSESRK